MARNERELKERLLDKKGESKEVKLEDIFKSPEFLNQFQDQRWVKGLLLAIQTYMRVKSERQRFLLSWFEDRFMQAKDIHSEPVKYLQQIKEAKSDLEIYDITMNILEGRNDFLKLLIALNLPTDVGLRWKNRIDARLQNEIPGSFIEKNTYKELESLSKSQFAKDLVAGTLDFVKQEKEAAQLSIQQRL